MWYYVALISFLAITLCVYDKHSAIKRRRRVRELSLYFVSLIGGALVMYITMLLIRHKTKRAGFMVLLPIMALAHLCLLVWYGKNYGYWI